MWSCAQIYPHKHDVLRDLWPYEDKSYEGAEGCCFGLASLLSSGEFATESSQQSDAAPSVGIELVSRLEPLLL